MHAVRNKRKKNKKRKKDGYLRSLPLSYSTSDKKQAELYLIILSLIDGQCDSKKYNMLKTHIFYRLRHYSQADKEDIFSDFVLSIMTGTAIPQVWHTNLYIKQRLMNAIKKFKRQKDKMVLVTDSTLEYFDELSM